jgi:hypothetical protein
MLIFLFHIENQQLFILAVKPGKKIMFKAASLSKISFSLYLNCNYISIEVHSLVQQGDGTSLGTEKVSENMI